MKLLVLSDSHISKIDRSLFTGVDASFHCGDYGNSIGLLEEMGTHYVAGNCDSIGVKYKIIECYKRRILLLHGDIVDVKRNFDRLIYLALEKKVSVCFFGHTHYQTCFKEEGILFLNPGAYPNYAIIDEDKIQLFSIRGIKEIQFRW